MYIRELPSTFTYVHATDVSETLRRTKAIECVELQVEWRGSHSGPRRQRSKFTPTQWKVLDSETKTLAESNTRSSTENGSHVRAHVRKRFR